MAIRGGPDISEQGLVVYYDAGNIKSYVPGNTTIQDISDTKIVGSFVGNTTYTGSFCGGLKFDGTNDYVEQSSGNFSLTSVGGTISVWVQHNTLRNTSITYMRWVSVQTGLPATADDLILRHVYSSPSYTNGAIEFVVSTSGTARVFQINNQLNTNTIYNFVGTWDGTTQRVYKNGEFLQSNTPGGTYTGGTKSILLSSNGTEALDGQIFSTAVYNRALSAQEILQNFNAQRSRFGL